MKLPPFVIFQDPTLEEMATHYPITLDELQKINGVGEGKAKKFGQAFADLIAHYVETHEVERPGEVVVKSVANKSDMKVAVIHAIDRKIPLDDFARNKGMSMAELAHELEGIVNTGTRIDLSYFLGDKVDSDDVEDMYDLLRNSESADVQVLIDEYGDVYEEDELRLIRVKFISDLGN